MPDESSGTGTVSTNSARGYRSRARGHLAGDAVAGPRSARSRHLRSTLRRGTPSPRHDGVDLYGFRRAYGVDRRRLYSRRLALAAETDPSRLGADERDPVGTRVERGSEIRDRPRATDTRTAPCDCADLLLPQRARGEL